MLLVAYRDKTMPNTLVFKRFKRFKNLNDCVRSDKRGFTIHHKEIIKYICTAIRKNSICQLCKSVMKSKYHSDQ